MAITVQYGPIASALGLAQQAGRGTGYLQQSQRDMQALALQNQMQGQINSNDANLIQMSLARDEMNARQQQAQQAAAQQQAYHQAELQQQQQEQAQTLALNQKRLAQGDQEFQAQQQTREQQATALNDARKQDLAAKQAKQDWLNSLSPEDANTVLSGGHIPSTLEQSAEQRRLDAEAVDRQLKYAELLQKDRDHLSKSVGDPLSSMSPEDRMAAGAKIKQLNLTIDGINAATGSKLGVGSSQPTSPQAQMSVPGGSPIPSVPDATLTQALAAAAQQLGTNNMTDPKVLALAKQLLPSLLNSQQGAARNAQVQAGSNKLQAQSAANAKEYGDNAALNSLPWWARIATGL